jgi:nucleotide-binding universal stress UspA family protein
MARVVLVGVDGSEGSRRALRWAIDEAAARGGVVQVLTVWRRTYDYGADFYWPVDEEVEEEATERLAATVRDVAGDQAAVVIDQVVVQGDPGQVLCARSAEVDLLVVGSRGHGGFAGLLLGSVSAKCAHHSRSPLVIVPTSRRAAPAPAMTSTGRVMVGVDGSEGSRRALAWAVEEAAARGVALDAVTVWRGVEDEDMSFELEALPSIRQRELAMAENAAARLERVVTEASSADPAVLIDKVVLEGDPAETLCQRATGADLLVVGSRGYGAFAGLLLGSVSAKCAHHSPCPVAIVPKDRSEPASTIQNGA